MREYPNLKYAERAGSDIILVVTISAVGELESRGSLVMRRLDVTDGHAVRELTLFGDAAERRYAAGQRLRAGPVYWSDQWQNFSLSRGGIVTVS